MDDPGKLLGSLRKGGMDIYGKIFIVNYSTQFKDILERGSLATLGLCVVVWTKENCDLSRSSEMTCFIQS